MVNWHICVCMHVCMHISVCVRLCMCMCICNHVFHFSKHIFFGTAIFKISESLNFTTQCAEIQRASSDFRLPPFVN